MSFFILNRSESLTDQGCAAVAGSAATVLHRLAVARTSTPRLDVTASPSPALYVTDTAMASSSAKLTDGQLPLHLSLSRSLSSRSRLFYPE